MQKFYNKYSRYFIIIIGLVTTILLTAAILYLNKALFTTKAFKALENYKTIMNTTNNLLGFSEGIVVFGTFVLYLLESSKSISESEKKSNN